MARGWTWEPKCGFFLSGPSLAGGTRITQKIQEVFNENAFLNTSSPAYSTDGDSKNTISKAQPTANLAGLLT